MASVNIPRSDDPRARAARTKRDRTRAALLHAAEQQFGTQGWARTRVEDIATDAGVSAATAYNHFPTKHVLIGHVFSPLVRPLRAQAEQDVAVGRPVGEALTDQIGGLVRRVSQNRVLSAAFLAACQEHAARAHGPPRRDDELDPRAIAPLPEAIRLLVEHGQATGQLRGYPAAADISTMIANMLLLRGVDAPGEPPERTGELLRTVLFGALRPEWVLDGTVGRATRHDDPAGTG